MTCTIPEWAPLAATALVRLRNAYQHATKDLRLEGRPLQRRNHARRQNRKMSDRDPSPLDEQKAATGAGADPLTLGAGGRDRPPVHVPATDLALMFRLCATIGPADRLGEIMAPGAVTLIETGSDLDATDAHLMLAATILPEDAVLDLPHHIWDMECTPDLCIVEIAANNRRPMQNAQERNEALVHGLEASCPALIFADNLATIPDGTRRVLPEPLRLASLSRDILMAILAAHNSATGKVDPSVYDLLPSDRDLAGMPEASLLIALRASTPKAVAARLSNSIEPPTLAKLSLDEIEGYGEAEAIARRMVSDLQAWSTGQVAWSDVQRSVLFWGPPGTGKSHLATAMAGSAGARLVRGSFVEWQSRGHLGDMLRAIRG